MESEVKQRRKRQANPDRITLSKTALENLSKLETEVDKAFGGMIKLKNKDLTNFLLEGRTAGWTNAELKLIKERFFDEVRAATWALQKLKLAKEQGQELKLSEVLAQLQTPLVKEKQKRKMGEKKKSANEYTPPEASSQAVSSATSRPLNPPSKA